LIGLPLVVVLLLTLAQLFPPSIIKVCKEIEAAFDASLTARQEMEEKNHDH
jgi:hypothetical protein